MRYTAHNIMLLLVTAWLAIGVGGCAPNTSTRNCPTFVAPMGAVVSEYNVNAEAVSWLSARANISLTVQEGVWSYTWGGLRGNPNGKQRKKWRIQGYPRV